MLSKAKISLWNHGRQDFVQNAAAVIMCSSCLHIMFEQVIDNNEKFYATYIDYSSAFDTVIHKFLDHSLAKAKASNTQNKCNVSCYLCSSRRNSAGARTK